VVLAQAFPDWIAQRRPGHPGRYLLACGAGAVIDSEDPLSHGQWLAIAQLGGAGTQARIYKAMRLNIDELERVAPELLTVVDVLDWDDRQERVLAECRLMIGSLIVSVRPMRDISAADKAVALTAGIRKRGAGCLPWTEQCRQWQARVLRMRDLPVPASTGPFPMVDDQALVDHLDSWLLPWLHGIGSMKALQQLDLYKALTAMLSYPQQVLMDEWLPVRFTVPSGSQITLSYTQPGNPVLSVRLQEMLGCSENPTVAQGALPLKVELLSPARRPVQVTEDLANFWTNSYPAVRKEMAGRYPKHVWPDDPLAAQPTLSTKRRR
jgi:ATP-dependent helicase HrpB